MLSKIDLSDRSQLTETLQGVYCHKCKGVPYLYLSNNKLTYGEYCRNCMKERDMPMNEILHHPKTPPLFHFTEIEKLHPKMQGALGWEPTIEKCGLILHGTTGIGKSRVAWMWIDNIFRKATTNGFAINIKAVSMSEMDGELMGNDSWKHHKTVLDLYCKVPLLYIDDLGKEKLTSRLAADLFAIIDYRTLNAKPTIITTNFNGAALIERFNSSDKETGIALVRRIRDYFTIFGMGNETTSQ